ncbi:MAG: V-type ATPase subunit [Nitrospinota bacterium]
MQPFGFLDDDFNQREELAHAVGFIRSLECRLIGRDAFRQAISEREIGRAWEVLREASDGGYENPGERGFSPKGVETAASRRLAQAIRDVASVTPHERVALYFAVGYDFQNLKALLRRELLGEALPLELSPAGFVEPESLVLALGGDSSAKVPLLYQRALSEARSRAVSEGGPAFLDLLLDRQMFSFLFQELRGECAFLKRLFGARADLTNLSAFIRLRARGEGTRLSSEELFVEGGALSRERLSELWLSPLEALQAAFAGSIYREFMEEGLRALKEGEAHAQGFGLLDKLRDDYIMAVATPGRYVAFGPEPLAAFLVAVEAEVTNVRLIMAGKGAGLPPAEITPLLRDTYV